MLFLISHAKLKNPQSVFIFVFSLRLVTQREVCFAQWSFDEHTFLEMLGKYTISRQCAGKHLYDSQADTGLICGSFGYLLNVVWKVNQMGCAS